ncbi:hypothetical protein GQ457_04G021790 [Hibiscus cannabinus]
MTRANPQGPIFGFDPEIERTQRNLKRRLRRLMEILFILDSSYFLHSNSGEKSVERNIYLFDIERVELKKQMNTVHVRDQKHELTPPRDMHGLPEWTQVSIFYNSINTTTRMMLHASANGTLLDKTPREGLEIFEKLTQNDYQHPTT